MNIFVLDSDITEATRAHCDTHCSKMILECAQMLSNASLVASGKLKLFTKPNGKGGCSIKGTLPSIYKADIRHVYHPCTKWVYSSQDCFDWLIEFAVKLNEEKIYRTSRSHASVAVVKACQKYGRLLPQRGLLPFAQAMPDAYRSSNAIKAYRRFYVEDKAHLLQYTRRLPPSWLKKHFVWRES